MSRPHDVHVTSSSMRRSSRGWRGAGASARQGSLRTGWNVTHGGRVLSRYRTQRKAAAIGRRLARLLRVDLVTHGCDGRIRSKDSYGNEGAALDKEH